MDYVSIEQIVKDLEANPAEAGGHIYHPIPFMEFAHLKTSSNSRAVYEKWALIEKILPRIFPEGPTGKTVLDIGANAGFYTYSLAQKGARVTAFEPHSRYSLIGPVVISEKNLDVRWHGRTFAPDLIEGQKFDLALMLSVFQWMAKGGEKLDEASRMLEKVALCSDHLLFELGFNAGKSCLTTTKRNHYAELVSMLSASAGYRYYKLLGVTKLWSGNRRYLLLCSNNPSLDDSWPRRLWRGVRW